MKLNQFTQKIGLSVAILAVFMPSLLSAKGTATVTFEDPESFTDIEMGAITTDKDITYITGRLEKAFTKGASRNLPDGYTIQVTVKDVDLAGDQDPFYSQLQDIRIYKEIYWPRIQFDYTIQDADGNTVSQSEANLKNMTYLHDIHVGYREITHYTDRLIKDWMKRDIRKILKNS